MSDRVETKFATPLGGQVADVQLWYAAYSFLAREAALLDAHAYEEWLELWEDDGVYWVPGSSASAEDPDAAINIVYDNVPRIKRRIAQLRTGLRHAQIPESRMVRTIGTVRCTRNDDDSLQVQSSLLLVESRRGRRVWSGHVEHRLKPRGAAAYGIALKKVSLVDMGEPQPTMAFLL